MFACYCAAAHLGGLSALPVAAIAECSFRRLEELYIEGIGIQRVCSDDHVNEEESTSYRVWVMQVEQLRAELSSRSGSGALVNTPTAPAALGAEAGSPLAAGQNGSLEVLLSQTCTRMQLSLRCSYSVSAPSEAGQLPYLLNNAVQGHGGRA